MADVENINGYNVGFSYLRFYQQHPEIGLPTDEQHGDVGGYQTFENAQLSWTGEKVQVYWKGSGPAPEWMGGETVKEFEV
jgi:hypothetical protein